MSLSFLQPSGSLEYKSTGFQSHMFWRLSFRTPGLGSPAWCLDPSLLRRPLRLWWKKVFVAQSCSALCDPMDCTLPGLPSMGFSRKEYWSGLPFPSPGDLHDPGIEPRSPVLQAECLPPEPPGKPLSPAFFFLLICLKVLLLFPTFFLIKTCFYPQ